MSERRTPTSVLALLAALCLYSGGAPPDAFVRAESDDFALEAPWTPEVPAIEQGLDDLGAVLPPLERSRVARTIAREARRAGFSPEFVLAVIRVESVGDPYALSPKGALGL